jgi:hypothetical protein
MGVFNEVSGLFIEVSGPAARAIFNASTLFPNLDPPSAFRAGMS